MILTNKKGVALLQVLVVTAILAGLATMILRASLSRTITSRQMRHQVNVQQAIESCMAEVNNIWASKTPKVYADDLAACRICGGSDCPTGVVDNNSVYDLPDGETVPANTVHTCNVSLAAGGSITVQARFVSNYDGTNKRCQLKYTVVGGVTGL